MSEWSDLVKRNGVAVALVVCPATKRWVMEKRSKDVMYSGTWGLPGGAVEDGEEPAEAARRELAEEVNLHGARYLKQVRMGDDPKTVCVVFTVDAESKLRKSKESTAVQWVDYFPGDLIPVMEEDLQTYKNLVADACLPRHTREALDTFSPAFRSWFGQSKVVDEYGKPMRMFHGTVYDIKEFKREYLGKGHDQEGPGFYFTSDAGSADGYASDDRTDVPAPKVGPNVMPVYLRITKPVGNKPLTPAQIRAIISAGDPESLWNFGDVDFDGKTKVLNEAVEAYRHYEHDVKRALFSLANDFYKGEDGKFLQVVTKVTGYDGMIVHRPTATHCVVFSPEQIKSVYNKAPGKSAAVNAAAEPSEQESIDSQWEYLYDLKSEARVGPYVCKFSSGHIKVRREISPALAITAIVNIRIRGAQKTSPGKLVVYCRSLDKALTSGAGTRTSSLQDAEHGADVVIPEGLSRAGLVEVVLRKSAEAVERFLRDNEISIHGETLVDPKHKLTPDVAAVRFDERVWLEKPATVKVAGGEATFRSQFLQEHGKYRAQARVVIPGHHGSDIVLFVFKHPETQVCAVEPRFSSSKGAALARLRLYTDSMSYEDIAEAVINALKADYNLLVHGAVEPVNTSDIREEMLKYTKDRFSAKHEFNANAGSMGVKVTLSMNPAIAADVFVAVAVTPDKSKEEVYTFEMRATPLVDTEYKQLRLSFDRESDRVWCVQFKTENRKEATQFLELKNWQAMEANLPNNIRSVLLKSVEIAKKVVAQVTKPTRTRKAQAATEPVSGDVVADLIELVRSKPGQTIQAAGHEIVVNYYESAVQVQVDGRHQYTLMVYTQSGSRHASLVRRSVTQRNMISTVQKVPDGFHGTTTQLLQFLIKAALADLPKKAQAAAEPSDPRMAVRDGRQILIKLLKIAGSGKEFQHAYKGVDFTWQVVPGMTHGDENRLEITILVEAPSKRGHTFALRWDKDEDQIKLLGLMGSGPKLNLSTFKLADALDAACSELRMSAGTLVSEATTKDHRGRRFFFKLRRFGAGYGIVFDNGDQVVVHEITRDEAVNAALRYGSVWVQRLGDAASQATAAAEPQHRTAEPWLVQHMAEVSQYGDEEYEESFDAPNGKLHVVFYQRDSTSQRYASVSMKFRSGAMAFVDFKLTPDNIAGKWQWNIIPIKEREGSAVLHYQVPGTTHVKAENRGIVVQQLGRFLREDVADKRNTILYALHNSLMHLLKTVLGADTLKQVTAAQTNPAPADLGKRLKAALATDEAYKLLDTHTGGADTWLAGGCALLARALTGLGLGHLVVLEGAQQIHGRLGPKQVQHWLVQAQGIYLDGDGASTKDALVRRWHKHESMREISLRRPTPDDFKHSTFQASEAGVTALQNFLKDRLQLP